MPPFPRGAESLYAACWRPGFCWRAARGGCWYQLQVPVRVHVLLGGLPAAAFESQRPDDLVRRVQRQRSGACFAWGSGLNHCCVTVPESRDKVRTFCGLPVPVVVRFMARAVGVVRCGWERLALVPQRTPPRAGAEYCRAARDLLPGPRGGALHVLRTAQGQVVRPREPGTTLVLGALPPPPRSPFARRVAVPRHPFLLGVGTRHRPFGVRALRAVTRPTGGGRLPRGGSSHRCEGRLVPGALPLRPASPWPRCPHLLGAGGVGMGICP